MSLKEAQEQEDWPKWKLAMEKELATLEHADTWESVTCPMDVNVVSSKWVFCIKKKANGSIEKYKAQLAACGFMQIYRVDYFSTYSSVAKSTSICLILALAAHHDWDIM